ncbi:hypothetical protein SynBIOSU31_01409 [Synechococcus sp. BIOS-U3-1]|nr:hypothetical protein SynBIOSU31_01409 [Synechococcus sp. BIOS-U3-1]
MCFRFIQLVRLDASLLILSALVKPTGVVDSSSCSAGDISFIST